jgi:hypothetical protein
MWEPQPLATLRASTVCTGITLPLPVHEVIQVIRNKFCNDGTFVEGSVLQIKAVVELLEVCSRTT